MKNATINSYWLCTLAINLDVYLAKQKTSCPRYCNARYFSRNNATMGRAKIFRRFFASIKPVICPRLSSFTSFIIFVHIFADLVNSQMLSFTPVCHVALSFEKNSTRMIKNNKLWRQQKLSTKNERNILHPSGGISFPEFRNFVIFVNFAGEFARLTKTANFPIFVAAGKVEGIKINRHLHGFLWGKSWIRRRIIFYW